MPPRYVKPYVKRNKSDMADADAICEAARSAEHAVCRNQDLSLLLILSAAEILGFSNSGGRQ